MTTIYKITSGFPDSEKFGLTNQLRRSAVSIPSNIAEGASRNSEKDFKRFLEIAVGSSYELKTQLIISNNLSFIKDPGFKELNSEIDSLSRQLNGLIKSINNKKE